jgi:hypothetical protein
VVVTTPAVTRARKTSAVHTTPTEAGAGAVLATDVQVVLWYRPRRGRPWERVARANSEREAWARVGTCGRKGGDWMILPDDKQP